MNLRILLFGMVLLIGLSCIGSYLIGEELDRTDPEKVANYVLSAIQMDNYEALIDFMTLERQQEYLPFTPEIRAKMEKLFSKDKKKAGKVKQVSELRKITTFRGKSGVCAKVVKKNDEIFVIILSFENDLYYYEDTLNLTPDLYNKLEVIKR